MFLLPSILVDIREYSKVVVQDISLDVVVERIVALLAKVARRLARKTVVDRHKLGAVDQTHLAHVGTGLGLENQFGVVGAVHVIVFLVEQSMIFFVY